MKNLFIMVLFVGLLVVSGVLAVDKAKLRQELDLTYSGFAMEHKVNDALRDALQRCETARMTPQELE